MPTSHSKVVDLTEGALNALPESAPFARVLAPRSKGVRDLSDARILVDQATDLDPPAVPGVTHCTLGSPLIPDLDHPLAMLIGDGVVRRPATAAGHGEPREFDFQVDTHLGGIGHLALLNEPAAYELIRGWTQEPVVGDARP